MASTIDDVLQAHDIEGIYNSSLRGISKTNAPNAFWLGSVSGGVHLATSYGGCEGRGSSLRAEAVGMLSIFTFYCTTSKIQQAY